MTDLSDEQLIASLKSEPEKAFRALYDRHSGVLLRFIFRFTGNRQAAEEILHDVFLELLGGNFSGFEAGGVKSWLFTLAKNKSLNIQRRQKLEAKAKVQPEATGDGGGLEEKTFLGFALTKLKDSERTMPGDLLETWILRRQGLGYQQIADHLAIPLGTVKSRFHRLVAYLREELEG
jgi:RNA polymerase sigma factor (sigma-70 family)